MNIIAKAIDAIGVTKRLIIEIVSACNLFALYPINKNGSAVHNTPNTIKRGMWGNILFPRPNMNTKGT